MDLVLHYFADRFSACDIDVCNALDYHSSHMLLFFSRADVQRVGIRHCGCLLYLYSPGLLVRLIPSLFRGGQPFRHTTRFRVSLGLKLSSNEEAFLHRTMIGCTWGRLLRVPLGLVFGIVLRNPGTFEQRVRK